MASLRVGGDFRFLKRRVSVRGVMLAAAVAGCAAARASAPFVTFTNNVATNAYATTDINSCSVDVNSFATAGGFQFMAYYDSAGHVMLGRRAVGSPNWTTYSTGLAVDPAGSGLTDDHNVIAIAVDSQGLLHMSWDMHNVALNYAVSNVVVTASSLTLNSGTFTKLTSTSAPTLFGTGPTNEVTYPQFYNVPGSNKLVFTYRNGGGGGGSGNGNQYVDIYSPGSGTTLGSWGNPVNSFMINGIATNVNGYLNSVAFTSTGTMMTSWTWRSSPDWRTNSNIMFAESPGGANLGGTWFKSNGTTQYTLPIRQSGAPAASDAEIVKSLPEGSSLINQTSMAVDKNNHPLIATWWSPGWTPTSTSQGSGNPNRQYMLEYFDGTTWKTSQITNRTSDGPSNLPAGSVSSVSGDSSAANVRDMGRPIVMTDQQGRVLVVTRSEDSGQHVVTSGNPTTAPGVDNELTVYWTDDLITGNTITTWHSLILDSTDMGSAEPTYDPTMWALNNTLDLFFEPTGEGSATGSVKVLEWNEQAYFASLAPEPASALLLLGGMGAMFMRRRKSAI